MVAAALRIPARLPVGALSVRVRGAVPEEIRRVHAPTAAAPDFPFTARRAGEYSLSVDVELEGTRFPVTVGLAEYWGSSKLLPEAFREAVERMSWSQVHPGVYEGDSAGAAVILSTRRLPDAIEVAGQAVVFAPTSGHVLVAGSDDLDGLVAAAGRARERIAEREDDIVSIQPLLWSGSGWDTWEWPRKVGLFQSREQRRLARAVGDLSEAFERALAEVVRTAPPRGSTTRARLGYVATDPVLRGWGELASALGLSADAGETVIECARDSIAYFDARDGAVVADGWDAPERHELHPRDVLVAQLDAAGSLVVLSRKSDPQWVAEGAAATPAARAAGARVAAPTAEEYDDVLQLGEALAASLRGFGVSAATIDDMANLLFVTFPRERAADIRAAERLIGEDVLRPL